MKTRFLMLKKTFNLQYKQFKNKTFFFKNCVSSKEHHHGHFLHIISTLYGCLNMNNFKISEIRAALSRLQLQIKEAADIKKILNWVTKRTKWRKSRPRIGKGRQVEEHHKMFADIIKCEKLNWKFVLNIQTLYQLNLYNQFLHSVIYNCLKRFKVRSKMHRQCRCLSCSLHESHNYHVNLRTNIYFNDMWSLITFFKKLFL